jgi:hypothetical protein
MSSQSGRGGMGSHKHGTSGHTRNNPVNMKQVARDINARLDDHARLRIVRRSEGMTGSVPEALGRIGKRRKRK